MFTSEVIFESGNEIEEGGVVFGALVISCGDAPDVFDLAEEAFDQVAVFVENGIEATPRGGRGSARHDGLAPVAAMASESLVIGNKQNRTVSYWLTAATLTSAAMNDRYGV